jgi:SIR2-like domain
MAPEKPAEAKYAQYIKDVIAEIANCVQTSACQPILFIGSGLSRRYFGGPSWDELLIHLAKTCPNIDKDYAYYKQSLGSPLLVGEEFAKRYQEWAWSKGKNQFPIELFNESVSSGAYIKFKIAEHLRSLTPKTLGGVSGNLKKEVEALRKIKPHAIITTNYDQFIELLFPEYQPIIGQQIIRGSAISVGEIFKIHGCVSAPESLVFTDTDYREFIKKKKYLSAKLLTYFSEHPLLFVGYAWPTAAPDQSGLAAREDDAAQQWGPAERPSWNFGALLGSLRPDTGELDHLAPLLGLPGDELAKFVGTPAQHDPTQAGKPLPDFRASESVIDLRVKLCNEFSRGVLASTHACQLLASYPGRKSARVGMSGNTSTRDIVVTARGRSLPALMYSIASGTGAKTTCTCPPSKSVSAGAPPRYGTSTRLTPASILNNSP